MKLGLYRHFKGGLYVVQNVALETEHQEEWVVYWSCKLGPGKVFVRNKELFLEEVMWSDMVKRPRFIYEDL